MRALPLITLAAAAHLACLGPGTLKEQPCHTDGPAVIREACLTCHVSTAGGTARGGAPEGVNFDTEGDLQRHAAAIRQTTLVTLTMPPVRPLATCNQATLAAYLDELEARPCLPSCSGRACGPDGCGGACGGCESGLTCDPNGQCIGTTCLPDCAGAACGPDGCGGSCGSCGADQACDAAGQCVCSQSCGGKQCGSDGCGGVCGTCANLQTCTAGGACEWEQKSYAADVQPIFQKASCGASGIGQSCHGGAQPAAGLDLSTAAAGHAALVNVFSTQCTSKLLVKPGDLAASYLMNKLLGTGMCSGSQMPKSGFLAPADLDVIRAWIGSGAAP